MIRPMPSDRELAKRIAERRKDEDFQRRLRESIEENRETLDLLAKGDAEGDETGDAGTS